MKKISISYMFILLVVLISCNRPLKKYYDTGELEQEIRLENDTTLAYITNFYKNGELKSEGNYILNNGVWVAHGRLKGYYKDGQIWYDCMFEKGIPVLLKQRSIYEKTPIDIDIPTDTFVKKNTNAYYCRFFIKDIYPDYYNIRVLDTLNRLLPIPLNKSGSMLYPYILPIEPLVIHKKASEELGIIKIVVIFPDENNVVNPREPKYKQTIEIPVLSN